ncbi:hypothetical protein GGS21DRAFT_384387 [Xylaria nigripes]|nr:hypothetical protein GGS21DRAFT_384387 [Xylaria nigripes]
MTSYLSQITLPTKSFQIAILLLGAAILLHAVTLIPPSPLIYLVRADIASNKSDLVTSTAWFSTVGHCIADANKVVLSSIKPGSQCSYTTQGYDATSILEKLGTTLDSTPDISLLLTKPLATLTLSAMTLGLLAIIAYQLIWLCHVRRQHPHWGMYLLSTGSTIASFLITIIAFVYEYGFASYIGSGEAATSYGLAAYAAAGALLLELSASSVAFYSCIGGKYLCEEDEEGLYEPLLSEKCPL